MSVKKPTTEAGKLTERFNRHFGNKFTFNEEEGEEQEKKDGEGEKNEEGDMNPEDDKKDGEDKKDEESDNDNGEAGKGCMGVIEKLIKEDMSSDNEKQKMMAECIGQLADSEEQPANAFMEALDDIMSSMEMQKNEDQDAEYLYVFQPEKFKAMGEARKKIAESKKKDKKKKK